MTRLENKAYYSLFELNPDGKKVLEELCNVFYDKPSYVKGDYIDTAYNEGAKSVIHFVLNKMARATENNNPQGEEVNE